WPPALTMAGAAVLVRERSALGSIVVTTWSGWAGAPFEASAPAAFVTDSTVDVTTIVAVTVPPTGTTASRQVTCDGDAKVHGVDVGVSTLARTIPPPTTESLMTTSLASDPSALVTTTE